MAGLSLQGFDDGLVRGLSVGNQLIDANARRKALEEDAGMRRQSHGLSMQMHEQQMRMNDDTLRRRDVAEQRQAIADERAAEQFGMQKEQHKLGLENARSLMTERKRKGDRDTQLFGLQLEKAQLEKEQLLMADILNQYDPSDTKARGLNDKQLKFLNDKGMLERLDSWAAPDLRAKIDKGMEVMNSPLPMSKKLNDPAVLDFVNTAFAKEISKGSKGNKRIVGIRPAADVAPGADPEAVVLMLDVDGKLAPMTIGRDANPDAPVMQVKLADIQRKALAIDEFNRNALSKLDRRLQRVDERAAAARRGKTDDRWQYFTRETPSGEAHVDPIKEQARSRADGEIEVQRDGRFLPERWVMAADTLKEQLGVDILNDDRARALYLTNPREFNQYMKQLRASKAPAQ